MKPGFQFILNNFAYLAAGKLRPENGGRPLPGHQVPADFVGVGVATSEDPAVDAYVIDRLRELGISQVRLDLTYGDEENHVARFLDALHEASFRIMLHLVPPVSAAGAMEKQEAQAVWRDFIVRVLDRFGEQIEMVEIGSVVNRRRWAGYTLQGLLNAWDIAFAEIRRRGIRLAGPNVTDFEPPFNIGFLSILQRRGQLPDVHTDNLFSERCTEPERADHKILGRRLAPLCGYTLIKKARLLQKIGRDFGVPEFISPAAFWTLPRIERRLIDGEEKHADYLARYMVLCAASGVMRRAFWGPLISQREGLVDECLVQKPSRDCIAHYAGVAGKVSDFRPRPAFRAMQTFCALIPGMHYEGRLSETTLLEVHAFASDRYRIHATWTPNGKAAALKELYSNEDLAAAEILSRDGNLLEAIPELISETPIYLRFPASRIVAVNAKARVLKHILIHRHLRKAHCLFREDDWQGMLVVENDRERDLLSAIHPLQIGEPPADALLRHARNAVWTIPDPREPERKLVIKKPVKMHGYKKVQGLFKTSKGYRSWNGAIELLRRGIDTAAPIACFEKKGLARVMQNIYICEYVNADCTARKIWSYFVLGETHYQGIPEKEVYRQLCEFVFRMHRRGVFFRDLSGGNILVKKTGEGELSFSLIDTGRAHFFEHAVPLSSRLSDLTRICTKMSWSGRYCFMDMYMGKLRKNFSFFYRIPFHLYDAKALLKRRFRRKKGVMTKKNG